MSKMILLVVCSIPVQLFASYGFSAMTDVVAIPQYKSKGEEQMLEQQAIMGSPEAAEKVASIYLLLMGNDKLYWSTIAAENGSYIGAYNITSILSDLRSLDSEPYGAYRRDRQWYWLKKSADKGYVYAVKDFEREFPEKEKIHLDPEDEIKRWVLSRKTLSKFKHAAMRGSQEAAYRLYQHYNSLASERKECKFWAIIAAQNEHPKAPLIVGKLMLKSNYQRERKRAQFWLRKAAAAGNKEANKLLEKNSSDGKKP